MMRQLTYQKFWLAIDLSELPVKVKLSTNVCPTTSS